MDKIGKPCQGHTLSGLIVLMVRPTLSMLVLLWVFVLAPGFCLGAIGGHDCGCAEAGCHDCQPQPGEAPHSHGCHDDPCPKDVCRTDPDELIEARSVFVPPSDTAADTVVDVLPAPVNDALDLASRPPDPELAAPSGWAELFALDGLPLLI